MIAEARTKTIAVDVDLTIVDTLTPWLNWIEQTQGQAFPLQSLAGSKKHSKHYPPPWVKSYNGMAEFMQERYYVTEGKFDKEAFMAFWKQPFLYQTLKPITGCVEAIKELSQRFDIVFVSHCFKEHYDSKKHFLDHHFRGMKFEFLDVSGSQKHLIRYDMLIDDTIQVIVNAANNNPRSHHILFSGVFDDVVMKPNDVRMIDNVKDYVPDHVVVADHWEEILDYAKVNL